MDESEQRGEQPGRAMLRCRLEAEKRIAASHRSLSPPNVASDRGSVRMKSPLSR
jgi:hypothetical protein